MLDFCSMLTIFFKGNKIKRRERGNEIYRHINELYTNWIAYSKFIRNMNRRGLPSTVSEVQTLLCRPLALFSCSWPFILHIKRKCDYLGIFYFGENFEVNKIMTFMNDDKFFFVFHFWYLHLIYEHKYFLYLYTSYKWGHVIGKQLYGSSTVECPKGTNLDLKDQIML